MDELIAFDIQGIEATTERLGKIRNPEGMREGSRAVAEYIVKELKRYPSPKRVSRKTAFGVTFFTDKQRRWFFANLREGKLQIPYRRTRTLMGGWRDAPLGSSDYMVYNEVPYAPYVQGDIGKSRMMTIIGWQSLKELVRRMGDRIGRIFSEAHTNYLRGQGLDVR